MGPLFYGMLLTPTWLRSHPVILACVVLLAIVRARPVGAAPAGIEALQAQTPTARVIFRSGSAPSLDVGKVTARGCDDSIPSFRCFEADTVGTVKGMYLNVGSFFDRRRPAGGGRPHPQEPRSASTHYFAKYFDPRRRACRLCRPP